MLLLKLCCCLESCSCVKCSSSCLAREICSCATMFRPPDSPAPQLPPEIRNKLVRIDVYAKNSNNNEEILPATWQQEQRRLGRRRWRPPAAPALRWRRPPAAPSGGAAAASPASASEEYRKQPTLPEAGMCCSFMRGWGCVADQARMVMCCRSGEDGDVLRIRRGWGPLLIIMGPHHGGVQWIRRA